MTLNLIKTINDDDDVEDYSEESEEETNVNVKVFDAVTIINLCYCFQFQPSKQKNKQKADFDTDFQFISSVSEYNKDVWDDIKKYVKRKAKAKTDDKILEARKKSNLADEAKSDQNIDIDKSSDISLSDDELKHDNIKVKSKKKSKVKEEEEPFFDESEVPAYDESATFYQMNLSRPLLKAIGELKYVHPTPVQAATIPVALLGELFYIIQNHILFLRQPNLQSCN